MVFIAETNKIIPATTKAAPASKLTPEFESFIANHRKIPRIIDAAEINSSRACARTIRTREGCDRIWPCFVCSTLGIRHGYITASVLVQVSIIYDNEIGSGF